MSTLLESKIMLSKTFDIGSLPGTLQEYIDRECKGLPKEQVKETIVYFEVEGERIILTNQNDWISLLRNKKIKSVKLGIISKPFFKPNIKFTRKKGAKGIIIDMKEMKELIEKKISEAKKKIEALLKTKEALIEEKKNIMINNINEISKFGKGNTLDIFCGNYFENALLNQFRQELNIDLLQGNNQVDSNLSDNNLVNKECCFCKNIIQQNAYQFDTSEKERYYCEKCFDILRHYYPSNYIKIRKKTKEEVKKVVVEKKDFDFNVISEPKDLEYTFKRDEEEEEEDEDQTLPVYFTLENTGIIKWTNYNTQFRTNISDALITYNSILKRSNKNKVSFQYNIKVKDLKEKENIVSFWIVKNPDKKVELVIKEEVEEKPEEEKKNES